MAPLGSDFSSLTAMGLFVVVANLFPARALQRRRVRDFQWTFHAFTIAPTTGLGFFDVPPNQIAHRQAYDQNNNDCIHNLILSNDQPKKPTTYLKAAIKITPASIHLMVLAGINFWQQAPRYIPTIPPSPNNIPNSQSGATDISG